MLHADVSEISGVPVIALSGRLDLSTIPTLQNALVRTIAANIGRRVAVDLDRVETLDDTAIGVLVGAAGRARGSGGDVVAICSSDALVRRFAITRIDRAIDIVPNAAAIASESHPL